MAYAVRLVERLLRLSIYPLVCISDACGEPMTPTVAPSGWSSVLGALAFSSASAFDQNISCSSVMKIRERLNSMNRASSSISRVWAAIPSGEDMPVSSAAESCHQTSVIPS